MNFKSLLYKLFTIFKDKLFPTIKHLYIESGRSDKDYREQRL
jgi:hypothetical protein